MDTPGNHGKELIGRKEIEEDRLQQRNADLVRLSIEGIVVVDYDGFVLFANPAAEFLLGKQAGSAVGSHLGYPASGRERSLIRLQRAKSESAIIEICAAETSWDGKPAFVVNLHDVTDSWHSEQELRQSEEKYRTLFETMSQGVVCQNKEGQITAANPAAERILGLSIRQMQSLKSTDPRWCGIHEDGSEFPGEEHPSVVALRTGCKVHDVIIGVFNPIDNEHRWLSVTAVPHFRAEEGQPYQVYTTFEDITAKKMAFDQAQRLAAIVQSTEDAIISKTLEGVIASWNLGAEKIYGYSADEVIGQNISMLIPDDMEDDLETVLEKIRHGEKVEIYETVRLRKNGDLIYVSLSVSPIRDETGNIVGASSIARNVTQQHKSRAELKKKTEELKQALLTTKKREKETRMLLKAARAVLENQSFELTARRIFDAGCEVTGAKAGYVALLSGDGAENEVLFLESGGLSCDVRPDLPMPIRGLRAEAYHKSEVVWENDFMNCEWAKFMPPGHVKLHNVLFAPLPIKEKIVGVMGLANKPNDFTRNDAILAGAFGNLAAIALQRSQSEELLRESEKKYRFLADATLDCIWMLDTNLVFSYVNPAVKSIFGYTPEEIIGTPLADYCDEAYLDEIQKTFEKELSKHDESGGTIFETCLRHRDGYNVSIEVTGRTVFNEEGLPIALQGTAKDITKRKQAEQALRDSEARLKQAERLALLGHWELELTKSAVYWSDEVYRIFEVDPLQFEVSYESFLSMVHPDERKLVNERYRESVRSKVPYDIEHRILLKDGRIKFVREQCVTYYDEQGNALRSLGTIQDITERKRAEEEKRSLEEQFQQSQKLESVGQLAGGVAHDFNNMLSVIIGYGQEILDQLHKSDPLRESAGEIVAAGKRSAELTRQLLAFSRRQTLQPEILDINHLIKNLEKMLRRLIGEDIELTVLPAEKVDSVEVDPGQIEQVIMNITVNARDAMPQGGKLIIETANTELDEVYASNHVGVVPGRYALISISDTGCGMNEETRRRIFEPFYTTKEKGKGTGLGLSTVYGIVKQSKGNIWVYSEPEKGSTFKIYLPCATAELKKKKAKKENEESKGEGEKILVVEDEPSLRKLCAIILKKLGYEVMVAANGGEALLLIEEEKIYPDLIITDVVMPQMSGKVLIDRLKQKLPDLKALYMSGYTDNAIVQHGILDADVPFIQKPFEVRELSRRIRETLKERVV